MMKIPLSPPFSKGEIRYPWDWRNCGSICDSPPFSKGEVRYPPLEKGGMGGFERREL